MVKHILAIIILSLILIMFMAYGHEALELLLKAHDWVANALTNVFSQGSAGETTREFIALLAIPVLIATGIALCYWILRRSWFPYFMQYVWVIWLVQAAALLARA